MRSGFLRVLLVLALSAPVACRIEPEAFNDDFEGSGSRISYSWSQDGRRLEAAAEGDLVFNDDDTGLVSISEGGFFSIEEEVDGSIRKWKAESTPDGSVAILYTVNGRPGEWDEEARQWLATTMPRVLRETGFDADRRTRRILDRQGVDGMLAEIAQVRGDRPRRIYLERLLDAAELTEDQLIQVVRQSRSSASSSELAQLVELVAVHQPGGHDLTKELIRTLEGIGTSSLRRGAIEEILRERDLDPPLTVALTIAAGEIRADFEKASVILAIAEKSPKTPETIAAFLDAASTIRSSSEKSRVLRELLSKPGVDSAAQAKAALAITGIHSSSEKAAALAKLAETLSTEPPSPLKAFLDAVGSIDSTSEQERVLSAFISRSDLGRDALKETLAFVRAELPEGESRQRLVERIGRRIEP